MKGRLLLVVLLVAGVLLASELNQGWFPHDDGALGQSAVRVLAGEVPHRDFDEIYTGALSYVHAAAFAVGPDSSATMRIPLFVVALLWVAALYAIALRFVPAPGAALLSITAFVWSVPNYPAPMPSWYNLFFATFGTLALLRGLESGRRRWFVLAGVAGGVSFLFKLSGIFFLLGGGLALIAASLPHRPDGATVRGGRGTAAIVTVALLLVLVVLAVPISRAGASVSTRLLLPLGLLLTAMVVREWRDGWMDLRTRGSALLRTLAPFAFGAAIAVGVWVLFLLSVGALGQTIQGVLVTPFRRTTFANMSPPSPSGLIYALLLGLLLVPRPNGRAVRTLALLAALIMAAIVYASATMVRVYWIGWLTAWGLPVLAAGGAAIVLLARGAEGAERRSSAAIAVAAVACSAMLVEFPFAAPIYVLYSLPLSMLAVMALVNSGASATRRTPVLLQVVVASFLLVFGVLRVIPGTVETLGSHFARNTQDVRLDLPRSGLRMRWHEAQKYQELIGAMDKLAPGRTLWAGPDSPEVYFLSGIPNRTRTMFEFLDATTPAPTLLERVTAEDPSLVIMKLATAFTPPPDSLTVATLLARYPHNASTQEFLILWR